MTNCQCQLVHYFNINHRFLVQQRRGIFDNWKWLIHLTLLSSSYIYVISDLSCSVQCSGWGFWFSYVGVCNKRYQRVVEFCTIRILHSKTINEVRLKNKHKIHSYLSIQLDRLISLDFSIRLKWLFWIFFKWFNYNRLRRLKKYLST